MHLTYLEKNAMSIGKTLGHLVVDHPGAALAIAATAIGGAAITSVVGNPLRGLYDIINESKKRNIMNYQADMLKNISNNTTKVVDTSKQQIPIAPPLR